MSYLDGQLSWQAAATTMGKFETPHYLAFSNTVYRAYEQTVRPNEDAVLYNPDIGIALADGMGSYGDGDKASHFLVDSLLSLSDELDIRELEPSAAVEAIRHELLPRMDAEFAIYKHRQQLNAKCGAAVAGILITCDDLIGVNAGDTSIYRFRPSRYGHAYDMLSQLTTEQCQGHYLTNSFVGRGRDMSGDLMRSDIIMPLGAEAGDRYLLVSDGILGDRLHQRIPEEFIKNSLRDAATPEDAVTNIIDLPFQLMINGVHVLDEPTRTRVPYEGKCDDVTIATLWISAQSEMQ